MDKMDLLKIYEIVQLAKNQIKEVQPDLDFNLDLSIFANLNDPVAIQAREFDWKPQRQDDSAWYEKSDEYIKVSVFVE